MIILFEENEFKFDSLGLGILKDATKCRVKEVLCDSYTLEMEYPITGLNFSKIKVNRIIYTKVNPYDPKQPFRIILISKPINGKVTITATHLSYDLNGYPVLAFSASNLVDALNKIVSSVVLPTKFTFTTDISSSKTYKILGPANLRAILMATDNSLLSTYECELYFDKLNVRLLKKRGKNRNAQIVYSKNMTDLVHEISNELLYKGVFPYYHSEKVSTTSTSADAEFQKGYIVGTKAYMDGWLSFTKDGEPYHPVSDSAPIQIATEGDYYQNVYVWSSQYSRYVEKIYNQQIVLIETLISPTWLTIDFSKFPVVSCKAAKKGYFKTVNDTEWSELKGVGDVVFEGNIVSSGMTENMIIYFSEVIPPTTSSSDETAEIIDVRLDDPIIYIDTVEANNLKYDNILALDLTAEFEEEPTQERLRTKAIEFINKNKLGFLKTSTSVAFVENFISTSNKTYENFDHIELGDTVKVIYQALGIEVELRVLSTTYDSVSETYKGIELGEKAKKLTETTIQTGDNITSLTNDAGYADITTVNKLIAKTVTAEYLEAINAKLSKAQIDQLTVERIDCKGIIEASQFTLDTLIAQLLVADNAQIKNVLEAGTIKVAGDINITSGAINIENQNKETKFRVSRDGDVEANSVNITGGSLNIGNGVFSVDVLGQMSATKADISGHIKAESGEIAGFLIDEDTIAKDSLGNGIVLSSSGVDGNLKGKNSEEEDYDEDYDGTWIFAIQDQFGVTSDGTLYTTDIRAKGGTIAGFEIKDDAIQKQNVNDPSQNIYIGTDKITFGVDKVVNSDLVVVDTPRFSIDNTGNLLAKRGKIAGFEINENSLELSDTVAMINVASNNLYYRLIDRTTAPYTYDKIGSYIADRDETITHNGITYGKWDHFEGEGNYNNIIYKGYILTNAQVVDGELNIPLKDVVFSYQSEDYFPKDYFLANVKIKDGALYIGDLELPSLNFINFSYGMSLDKQNIASMGALGMDIEVKASDVSSNFEFFIRDEYEENPDKPLSLSIVNTINNTSEESGYLVYDGEYIYNDVSYGLWKRYNPEEIEPEVELPEEEVIEENEEDPVAYDPITVYVAIKTSETEKILIEGFKEHYSEDTSLDPLIHIGTDKISLGKDTQSKQAKFSVDSKGEMFATGATISKSYFLDVNVTGTIYASKGDISGFEINESGLYRAAITKDEITKGLKNSLYIRRVVDTNWGPNNIYVKRNNVPSSIYPDYLEYIEDYTYDNITYGLWKRYEYADSRYIENDYYLLNVKIENGNLIKVIDDTPAIKENIIISYRVLVDDNNEVQLHGSQGHLYSNQIIGYGTYSIPPAVNDLYPDRLDYDQSYLDHLNHSVGIWKRYKYINKKYEPYELFSTNIIIYNSQIVSASDVSKVISDIDEIEFYYSLPLDALDTYPIPDPDYSMFVPPYSINIEGIGEYIAPEDLNDFGVFSYGSDKDYSVVDSGLRNDWSIISGDKFGVTNDGVMYCNGAYIKADDAKIGNLRFDSNGMSYYANDEEHGNTETLAFEIYSRATIQTSYVRLTNVQYSPYYYNDDGQVIEHNLFFHNNGYILVSYNVGEYAIPDISTAKILTKISYENLAYMPTIVGNAHDELLVNQTLFKHNEPDKPFAFGQNGKIIKFYTAIIPGVTNSGTSINVTSFGIEKITNVFVTPKNTTAICKVNWTNTTVTLWNDISDGINVSLLVIGIGPG